MSKETKVRPTLRVEPKTAKEWSSGTKLLTAAARMSS